MSRNIILYFSASSSRFFSECKIFFNGSVRIVMDHLLQFEVVIVAKREKEQWASKVFTIFSLPCWKCPLATVQCENAKKRICEDYCKISLTPLEKRNNGPAIISLSWPRPAWAGLGWAGEKSLINTKRSDLSHFQLLIIWATMMGTKTDKRIVNILFCFHRF